MSDDLWAWLLKRIGQPISDSPERGAARACSTMYCAARASAGWWAAEDLLVGGDPVDGDHLLGGGEGDAARAEKVVQCALEFVLGVRGGSRLWHRPRIASLQCRIPVTTTIDAVALRRFFSALATRARKQATLPADPMATLDRISVPEHAPRGVPPPWWRGFGIIAV